MDGPTVVTLALILALLGGFLIGVASRDKDGDQ